VDFVISVLPSVGVTFLFVVGIRALIHADRRERIAQARIEAAQDVARESGKDTPGQ
jgi:hypothetical protein